MSKVKWFKLLIILLLLSNTSYIFYTILLKDIFINTYYIFCELIVIVAALILLQNLKRLLLIRIRYEPTIFIVVSLFVLWQLSSCYLNGMFRGSIVARILCWPMLFIAMYMLNLHENDFICIRKIVNVSCVVLAILCIPLIYTHLFIMQRAGAVIFPTYLILSMTPLLILVNDRKKAYKILILIIIFMAITTKRSGFFVSVVNLIIYYLFDNSMNITISKRIIRLLKITILSVFVIIFLFIASKFINISIVERILEMKEDGGSGRDGIWASVLTSYKDLRAYYQFIGTGYEGVSRYVMPQGKSLSAHNDFLEVLYDYGKIGVVLFIIIWIKLFIYAWISRRTKFVCHILIIITSMFMLSMFSYLFIQSFVIQCYVIALGLIMRLNIERTRVESEKKNINYCSNI